MFLRSLFTFVVAYFLFLLCIMIYRIGLVGPKFTHNTRTGKCATYDEISDGAEDIEISSDALAFISSGFEVTSRFSSSASEKNKRGAMYVVDMSLSPPGPPRKLNIIGDLDLEQFAPHGISLWQQSGKTFVFVVNHKLAGVDTVEKFLFEPVTMSLRFIKQFHSEFYYNLNDVAATGVDSFYFTNLNYFVRLPTIELYANIRYGSIGYQASASRSKLLLDDLEYPNGVMISPDARFLHMTTSISGIFQTYTINPKDYSIDLIQSETMNLYLDNIGYAKPLVPMGGDNNNNNKDHEKLSKEDPTIDEELAVNNSTYTLLLGGHTSMWDCIGYLKYPHNVASGSMVLKIQVNTRTGLFDNSDTVSVFSDDGHRFSGCSVAVGYGDTMLLGSVATKMMQCSQNTFAALDPVPRESA